MNFGFHIIGNPGGHFCQLPKDNTSGDNSRCIDLQYPTALYIKRNATVISYVYCRHYTANCYIGFRITLNSMQISKPKALVATLSMLTDNLLTQGRVVRLNDAGGIDYCVTDFAQCGDEVERIRQYVAFMLESYPHQYGLEKLKGFPEKKEQYNIPFAKPDSEIEAATYDYVDVCVYDNAGTTLGPVPEMVGDMSTRIRVLKEDIAEKEDEISSLQRQKKQFKVVVGLMALLLGAGVWLYSLKGNLDMTQGRLNNAESKIVSDSLQIVSLNGNLDEANAEIAKMQGKLSKIKSASSKLHSTYYLPDWYSTNHRDNSKTEEAYHFYAYPGDEISFNYNVDSEGPDKLFFRVSGPATSVSEYKSGRSVSGRQTVALNGEGYYTLYMSYTKDVSVSHGIDRGCLTDITITRGDTQSFLKEL